MGSNTIDTEVSTGGQDVYSVDWNEDGSVFVYGMNGKSKINNGSVGYFTQNLVTHTFPSNLTYSVDFSYDS